MIARVHRRQLLQAAAAGAAAAAFPAPMLAQGAGPPVVVIGGGFGGASCARALRKADPRIAVTLVEANATYTALPHSNAVIGGLVDLKHQQSPPRRVRYLPEQRARAEISPRAVADPGTNCAGCHTDSNYTLHEGAKYQSIPGHARREVAPLSMAWEGKSLREICRRIR